MLCLELPLLEALVLHQQWVVLYLPLEHADLMLELAHQLVFEVRSARQRLRPELIVKATLVYVVDHHHRPIRFKKAI